MVLRATPQAVRRLAIRNQRLDGPAPRGKPTAQDLLETVRALRCLQLDPTAVVARNHLLVLFSRHGAFDERAFEQLAYEDRALFEYWAHEASYVLSEDLPIHRLEMRTWPPPSDNAWRRRVAPGTTASRSSARTSSSGSPRTARCARARSRTARTVPWESSGWTNARSVARMLDLMWVAGPRSGSPAATARSACGT